MGTTTYPLIRDQQISLIQALTPAFRADKPFRVHTSDVEFEKWSGEHPGACWRRFEIISNVDYGIAGTTNPLTTGALWLMTQSMVLALAYPRAYGKYGREGLDNERDLDDCIDSDLAQIDNAIGLGGGAGYVDGLHRCERTGASPVKTESTVVVACTYSLLYDRSY